MTTSTKEVMDSLPSLYETTGLIADANTVLINRAVLRSLVEERDALSAIRAHEAAKTAVPQGWKLVPLEPTPQMAEALLHYEGDEELHWPNNVSPNFALAAYRIMLAAAPTPEGKPEQAHDLYTDADKDRPSVICDRNGQVTLSLCKRCGKGESQLDGPCVETSKPEQAEAPSEPWRASYDVRVGRDNADCIDLIFTKVAAREFALYPNEAAYLRDLLNAASIPGYPASSAGEREALSEDEITLLLADKIGFGDSDLQTVNRGDLVSIIRTVEARAALATKPLEQKPVEPLTRFCPGCGSVGTVDSKYRDCCPDGSDARMIPEKLATKCRDLFYAALDAAAQPEQVAQDREEAKDYQWLLSKLNKRQWCGGGYEYLLYVENADREDDDAKAIRAARTSGEEKS